VKNVVERPSLDLEPQPVVEVVPEWPDGQLRRWERAFAEQPDRYGSAESAPARAAARAFGRAGVGDLLELGGGQGRDTLFFAGLGLGVTVVDFATIAVATIERKGRAAGLEDRISALVHDVRRPLPFAGRSFDACYAHMLFCMALSEAELRRLTLEVRRVLRPGGLCIYTARTTDDPDYGRGTHNGESLYENDGFVVHFFDRGLVERLAPGFDIVDVTEFEEGALPRRLFRVTLRKRASRDSSSLDARNRRLRRL
jgi:SAM-dependent methyltransferase